MSNAKKRKAVAELGAKLERCKANIGKERDTLRDLMGEYADLLESTERGEEALEECIDALSEFA